MGRDFSHACCNIISHSTYPQSRNLYMMGSPHLHPLRSGVPVCFGCVSRTLWTVTPKLTTVYHPQTNMTERVNRILKCLMASNVEENHKKWDVYLPEFRFALNSAVQETIGLTPAELHIGRKLWKEIVLWIEYFRQILQFIQTLLPMRLSTD